MRTVRAVTHPDKVYHFERIMPCHALEVESFPYTITVREALKIAEATIGAHTSRDPGVIGSDFAWTKYQEWYALFGSLDQRDINDLLHPRHFYRICQAFLEKRLNLTGEWRTVLIIKDQSE